LSIISGEPAAVVPTGAVAWRPWGREAFEFARDNDRPILLSINAVWCYWCHEMDSGAYSDHGVIQFVNAHFTPVRVDTDHRPDVNARYNVGGWPTTSFLTPHGGFMAGATYLPPDQLLAMLDEVRRAYTERKPELYEQGNDILRQRREHAGRVSAGRDPDAGVVDAIARRVAGTYDAIHGGFGLEPKFPSTPMLRLLLHRYRTTGERFFRVMLEKTLDAINGGDLRDRIDGGFFRFTIGRDWTQAQYEKMAEDNIPLAGVLMDAGVILGREDYLRVAGETVDYICATLYDPSARGVRGSQGAHSEYFAGSTQERSQSAAPAVDPFCYASVTAQAVSLLLGAAWKLGRPELSEAGVDLLDGLIDASENGGLPHAYTATGALPQNEGDLLVDWANFLVAALDGYDALPSRSERCLASAERAGQTLLNTFLDGAHGGFWDVESGQERLGYLHAREKPLAENTRAAIGMMRMHQATLDDRYRQTARHTLSAYVDANRDYGELAADYAVAVDQYLHPVVEVTVEGSPGTASTDAMLAAAMRLDAPHLIIKFVPVSIENAMAQAHVCLDTVCYPPVTDPEELAATVAEGGAITESPFQNVLDLLG
jgi:uncharacterized protein YyaL (SSP411 family)